MSSRQYVIGDTHFSHGSVCTFMRADGTKLRPWDSVAEMNEYLVDSWNSVVRDCDKVFHLGDVLLNRSALPILSRLKGNKILIKGNHDSLKLAEYASVFKDVCGSLIVQNHILSHIPIHPQCKGHYLRNIHGHLHAHHILLEDGSRDPFYFNASVEQINYTPLLIEEALLKIS